MSERRANWPFPTPPFRVEGTHPADIEPQTSWSRGGLGRLGAVINRLDRDAAELAAWWAETRPTLEGDLDPDDRRRYLRSARTLAWMVSIALEGLGETVTHMAACDGMAGADEELASLIDRAMCWDFTSTFRQEDEAAAHSDPLDNPEGFRAELRRRLQPDTTG